MSNNVNLSNCTGKKRDLRHVKQILHSLTVNIPVAEERWRVASDGKVLLHRMLAPVHVIVAAMEEEIDVFVGDVRKVAILIKPAKISR